MNRKIIYIILALLFFIGAVTFYVNTIIIPRQLKRVILEETQEFLKRQVSLKSIHFNPLKGFVLDNIVIYEKDSTDIFATIDHATVRFLFLSFLMQQKIVLSSLEVHGITAQLIHYAEDQWNFTDITEGRQSPVSHTQVYFSHIQMTKGKIKLIDLEAGSQFSETFDDAALRMDLSLSKGITLHLSTRIPQQNGWIETKGSYQPFKNIFKGQLKLKNVPLAQYLKLSRQKLPVTLQDIYINDADLILNTGKHRAEGQGWGSFKNINILFPSGESLQTQLLTLQKGEFGFNEGEINAKGLFWTKGAKATLGASSYSLENANVEVTGLNITGRNFFTAGNITINHASATSPHHPAFQGDITANNLRVTNTKESLSASGYLRLQNSSIHFSEAVKLAGDFTCPFLSFETTPSATAAKGTIDAQNLFFQWPTGKELRGNVSFQNFSLTGGLQEPWIAEANLLGTGIMVNLLNNQTFSTDLTSSLNLKAQPSLNYFELKNNFHLNKAIFQMKNGMKLTANPAGTIEVRSVSKADESASYSGSLTLENALLSGTPIGTIDTINGPVSFKNSFITTSRLSFNALGMAANLNGDLTDFTEPDVDVKIRVDDFDLSKAREIVPKFFDQNLITLQGPAAVNVSYKGLISDVAGADVRFNAELKGASAQSGKLNQNASQLFGRVDYKNNYFAWKNLKAVHNQTDYLLTGKLTNFSAPSVETSLRSQNLKLSTQFDYTHNLITFQKLNGVYKRLAFDVTGTSRPSADNKPLLNLSGNIDLSLKDLPQIQPLWAEILKPYQLSGDLNIKGQFQGDPVHWQDWGLNLTGSSPEFSIWGAKLMNMKFNFVQKDSRVKPFHLWGEFYKGDFNSIASVDLAKPDLPFNLITKVTNAELSRLKLDTALKKHDLTGSLSTTSVLDGSLNSLKDLHGKGGVEIKDGKLWELDLLKGLGGIILIPEYKDIVFTQAGMNFTVKDQILSTENIQLLSPSLALYGHGTLNFDQTLNLLLSPNFNPEVIAGSASLKKGTTAIISSTEKFMTVEVTGTLSKPQYKVNKSPVKILQKTGGVILENVSQFFQNIF